MKKIISFSLHSDMGVFKKPDINNDGISLTYNMIPRTTLLGVLGAILGLNGFSATKKELPEYYVKLSHIKVGISPFYETNPNLEKTSITYNNSTGFANKGGDKGGATFIAHEQTLIKPSYISYLLINLENELEEKLFRFLKESKSKFIPYMGKNEFPLWWDNFNEYSFSKFINVENSITLRTLFKTKDIKLLKEESSNLFNFNLNKDAPLFYFEKLPSDINEKLRQANIEDFCYTTSKVLVKKESKADIYEIESKLNSSKKYVYLF